MEEGRWPAVALLLALALLALVMSACAARPPSVSAPVTTGPLASERAPSSAAVSPAARPTVPPGFPVISGANAIGPPGDDPSVIARWTVAAVGSGPYDFYSEALPAAGMRVVGRYPAENAALIRFTSAGGAVWQLLLELTDGVTTVTLQTDRP